MSEEKLTMKDFIGILKVKELEENKPMMVIVATRCEECNKLHPFIFTGEQLYHMKTYSVWHQYRDCECGEKAYVNNLHGDIIFNPHNVVPAT